MKKIINVIVILIILIIIVTLLIFYLNYRENKDEYLNDKIGDEGETIEITNKIQNVDSINDFNIVEKAIQEYYDSINENSSNFFGIDENGQYMKIVTDKEISQMRLDLLSEEYINENYIN